MRKTQGLLLTPIITALAVLSVWGLTACASGNDEKLTALGDAAHDTPKATMCPETRPQMCTKEYRPVCATLSDGSQRTYSTGCTSCADHDVVSFVANPCPENN